MVSNFYLKTFVIVYFQKIMCNCRAAEFVVNSILEVGNGFWFADFQSASCYSGLEQQRDDAEVNAGFKEMRNYLPRRQHFVGRMTAIIFCNAFIGIRHDCTAVRKCILEFHSCSQQQNQLSVHYKNPIREETPASADVDVANLVEYENYRSRNSDRWLKIKAIHST